MSRHDRKLSGKEVCSHTFSQSHGAAEWLLYWGEDEEDEDGGEAPADEELLFVNSAAAVWWCRPGGTRLYTDDTANNKQTARERRPGEEQTEGRGGSDSSHDDADRQRKPAPTETRSCKPDPPSGLSARSPGRRLFCLRGVFFRLWPRQLPLMLPSSDEV